MFGSTIVDVAVGLMFFYFLLSMITSHLNEVVAGTLKWRANELEDHIRKMLGDPELANRVLSNPMITSIAGGHKPSYIPPNTFALALFDALVPEGQTATFLDQVQIGMKERLPSTKTSGAVIKIVDRANGDMKQARMNAEEWFNASMDRLTGVYKRRMQWLTLGISLVITFGFGADTLSFANVLYKEPSLRAAVNGTAQSTISGAQAPTANAPGSVSTVQQSVDKFLNSGFPLGWGDLPTDAVGWIKKTIGLLLTTLAVTLGAPFWFNVLKEIGSLRSSGPVPSTTSASDNPLRTQTTTTVTTPIQPPSHP